MRVHFVLFACLLAASGCADRNAMAPATSSTADPDQTRPEARPDQLEAAPPPPSGARTVEEFDTTTNAERNAAATTPEPGAERSLGFTIASLGDVAKPGFWLETPLVKAPVKGRVVFGETGKSAQVDLIPIPAPPGAGSRISLAAMRLLDAPLAALPKLEVFTSE